MVGDGRTFKVVTPLMSGSDVKAWQVHLLARFAEWDIGYELEADGFYGRATRAATLSFLRAWGSPDAGAELKHGLPPELRTRVRNNRRTVEEANLFKSAERQDYRAALRRRFASRHLAVPVKILEDDWGWHGAAHDGVDLICPPSAPLVAICDARVVRADKDGWWGKGAPSDPALKALGDGITILECLVNEGPFKRGLHFAYGHAERPACRVGEIVRAGQQVATAGFAVAWHVHFMVNADQPVDDFYRGTGDRDPMPFINYVELHS